MIYLVTFILSLILTWFFYKLGNKYKIYDNATDDPLKIHKKSTSFLGGSAMFLTVSLILLFTDFSQYNLIVLAGFSIFLFGLIDDLKWRDRLKNVYKFYLLLPFTMLTTIIVLIAGFRIEFIPIIIIAEILTFLAIFILINSVNFQDGMDGIAGSTVLISLIGFLFITNSLIPLILILAILGFLVFNFPPAKIFMGDSGAYYLGFMLAVLTMMSLKAYDFISLIGVMLILGLPLYEGISTNVRRLVSGKPIFAGDRDHFFDKLLKKGYSVKKTLLICISIQIVSVVIGVLIYENTLI